MLDKYQQVIDETNKVLAIWKETKHALASPTHFDIQSLFLSKLRKILSIDYVEYSRIVRMGKPIAFVHDWRIKNIYSSTEYVNANFAKCDYHKEIPGYEPVVESVHSINFSSIQKIKFN